MKNLPLFFLILLTSSISSHSQQYDNKIEAISRILEIEKQLYYLNMDNSVKLGDLQVSYDYIRNLIADGSKITEPEVKFIFDEAEIKFYKFISLNKTLHPYVRVFGISKKNDLLIINSFDEITFYEEIAKILPVADSLKLYQIAKIYENIYLSLTDYPVEILKDAQNLPFYNFAVEEDYFKVNSIDDGFYYRMFINEETENSEDSFIVTLILKNDDFSIKKELYKRIPK